MGQPTPAASISSGKATPADVEGHASFRRFNSGIRHAGTGPVSRVCDAETAAGPRLNHLSIAASCVTVQM
jgi:hypothetical protein